MKVYVDELPKDDCPCNRDGRCRLLNKECYICYEMGKNNDCPLQSIADYTKQVRKELIKEIKQKILNTTCYETEEEVHSYLYDLNAGAVLDILDKIQGE